MGTSPSKQDKIKVLQAKAPPATTMADALFPRTKQRVLSLLFGQPDRAFGTTELFDLAASGRGQVQRELQRLVESGLVTATVAHRQKTYQANRHSPLFTELAGIIQKTSGVPELIRAALAPLAPKIKLALVYGSVAKGSDTASSDVDLILVADELPLEDAFAALEPVERQLGRAVSPTIYSPDEFLRRRRSGNAFLNKVLAGKHIVLMGNEDAYATAR